jgi:hypothetical protein
MDYTPEEVQLYDIYAARLVEMDNAVKETWAPSRRPKQHGKTFKLKDNNEWTTDDMGTKDERSAMNTLFSQGLVFNSSENFLNLDSRMKFNHTSDGYTTVKGTSRSSFPTQYDGKFMLPNIIKLEISDPKWRYDSTSIGQYASKSIGGKSFTRPEQSYCQYTTVRDEAVPALYDDIQRYHDFYQDLFDYAINFHCHGYSHKCDQYEHLIKYSYRNNKFTTQNFPYTITRSTLATWWMWHWNGIFYAGHLKRQNSSYDNMKMLEIPNSELTKYVSGDDVPTYWMKYIIHWDKVPYMVEEGRGLATLFGDLFTDQFSSNDKFSRWRSEDWFNSKTINGGSYVELKNGLISVKDITSQWVLGRGSKNVRYVPITYYYVTGGTSSSDYNLLGKIADAVRRHDQDGKYDIITCTYKSTDDTYYYVVTEKAKDKLKKASGLTFRAINTSKEEDYAKTIQEGQWE